MNIWSIGVNHRSAPVEIREKLAFNKEQLPDILKKIVSFPKIYEVVLVSTCNRTEIYCVADDLYAIGRQVLAKYFNVDELRTYTYTYSQIDAVKHLMRVSCGLDSMVLGESQILGQLKDSYKVALDSGSVGRILGRLFQRAFSSAKIVRVNTDIGVKPVSVASVAAKLAKHLFSDVAMANILVLGAGDTAYQLLAHLKDIGNGRVFIANRTTAKAKLLADKLAITDKAHCIGLDDVERVLIQADIVLGATAAPGVLIDEAMVKAALKQRKYKSICFFDMAVPRDFDAKISSIENVFLYGVDDLKTIIAKNKTERAKAGEGCQSIIETEAYNFMRWFYSQGNNALIADFRAKFESKKQSIIRRATKQLNNGANAKVTLERVAHSIAQEFLHVPTLAIKDASEKGDQELLTSVEKLFNLKEKN